MKDENSWESHIISFFLFYCANFPLSFYVNASDGRVYPLNWHLLVWRIRERLNTKIFYFVPPLSFHCLCLLLFQAKTLSVWIWSGIHSRWNWKSVKASGWNYICEFYSSQYIKIIMSEMTALMHHTSPRRTFLFTKPMFKLSQMKLKVENTQSFSLKLVWLTYLSIADATLSCWGLAVHICCFCWHELC